MLLLLLLLSEHSTAIADAIAEIAFRTHDFDIASQSALLYILLMDKLGSVRVPYK